MITKREVISSDRLRAYEELPVPLTISLLTESGPQLLAISEGFCQMLGYSRNAFFAQYRQNKAFFLRQEEVAGIYDTLQKVGRQHATEKGLTVKLGKANGNYLSAYCWLLSQKTATGATLCYIFYNDNATLFYQEVFQKQAVELQRTIAEYDMLLAATGVCIVKFVLQPTPSFTWFNEAAVRTLGYTFEQYEAKFGQRVEGWFGQRRDTYLQLKKRFYEALRNKKVSFDIFAEIPVKTGQIWIKGVATFGKMHPKTHNPQALYVVFNNVTDNVKARETLAKAKWQADKANESKSVFLSSMSHDLRTPLNGIIGFTRLALQTKDDKLKQDYLEKIKLSGDLLLDLINDTLEISRIESGKLVLQPEAVDGRTYWASVVNALLPSVQMKNITLQTDTSAYPGEMILVDKTEVKKILLNLLSNAIKYTPAGGRIKVDIAALEPAVKGCTRRIIIEDNGMGMSEEFLQRMYEPFSQEKQQKAAKVTGTGLGLSIVKRIVDFMGGSITCQSKLGVGTRFTVDLPIEHWKKKDTDKALATKREQDKAAQALLAGCKVLLCEDNYLNAEIAMLLLKDKKMQVDWVQDGQLGVDKFKASLPAYYDVILMDIQMPRLNGYEATAAIRHLDRQDAASVPIAAMTADAFAEDKKQAKKAGMNGFITKPIVPQQMYGTLAELLAKK